MGNLSHGQGLERKWFIPFFGFAALYFNIDKYSGRNQDVSVSQSHSIAFNLQGLSGAPWRSLITDKMRVN